MRKGYALIELLEVIVVLSVFSVVLAGLFTTIIKDIPRSYRVIEMNTTLLNMLKHLRADIDSARGLPESFGQYSTNDQLLLIELPDGMVCYQLKNGELIRRRLTNGQKSSGARIVWSVPQAKIKWQVWSNETGGYAVEVKTHIEQIVGWRWQKKMANSHLYFVGGFRKVLK